MMTGSNDSLTAIADDLDQLADETAGNESRPSAEDISARARQAAKRCRALQAAQPKYTMEEEQQPVTPLPPVMQPVVGAFAPPFAGQRLTATHPRALGDIPAAYETPEERHAAALGEDFQTAGGNANLAADEVVGDDLPVAPDPASGDE